jgi:serine/threonine protein phosphatase PrpC
MLNQFKAAYVAHAWVRRIACIGLCAAGILLASLTGGFPPWAWRFPFQVLPQLGRLWQLRGIGIIPPLFGLTVLALTLFVLWGLILLAVLLIVRHWWRARRELYAFDEDLARAATIPPALQEEEEMIYDIPLPSSSSVGARVVGSGGEDLYGRPRGGGDRVAPSRTPIMAKPARNVRYDVQMNNAYMGAPTVPVALVDAQNAHSAGSSIYLDVGTGLDAGLKRRGQPNEDTLLALPTIRTLRKGVQPVGLFVVADGMGGHGNGQEASRLAISSLHDAMQLALVDGPEDDIYEELLAEGVHTANLAVHQRNRQKQADMGTTITAVLIIGNTAYVANVGDSRTYLYRESDGLIKVTRDHSAVARLVESGAITPDEVYTHPKRNEIYRSLGNSASVKVDTFTVPLKVGDLLLLCSDGLWEMVRDADIERIMEAALPVSSQICDTLVEAALAGGGKDNISVIAVCVRNDAY